MTENNVDVVEKPVELEGDQNPPNPFVMAPRETDKPSQFLELLIGHFSMEFNDPERQQKSDATKIFDRDYDVITGTEAGRKGTLLPLLRVAAHKAGYTFHMYKSNWIAVKKTLIKKGTYRKTGQTVVDNDELTTHGNDLAITRVGFEHEDLGELTFLASHYPRFGRPVKDEKQSENLPSTKKLAAEIGDQADKFGKGESLVWYSGDQNINDRLHDTFLGKVDLTSIQDELKKYESTGFGPIDVIASYDHDRRVEAMWVNVLTDDELHLYSDHYGLEACYRVKALK